MPRTASRIWRSSSDGTSGRTASVAMLMSRMMPPCGSALARPVALPLALLCLLLGQIELALHGVGLVRDLEPLLQDRDRVVGATGEAQRPAEVVERIRVVQVGGAGRERVDRLLEDRDRVVVATLVHQLEALGVQLSAACRA